SMKHGCREPGLPSTSWLKFWMSTCAPSSVIWLLCAVNNTFPLNFLNFIKLSPAPSRKEPSRREFHETRMVFCIHKECAKIMRKQNIHNLCIVFVLIFSTMACQLFGGKKAES